MNREKLYDLIYNKADKLFKQYNPCNISIDHNGNVSCLRGTGGIYSTSKYNRVCCGGCHYWTLTGCSVRCLRCKLYLCDIVECEYPGLSKKIDKLIRICHKYSIPLEYFKSKEEVFNKKAQYI